MAKLISTMLFTFSVSLLLASTVLALYGAPADAADRQKAYNDPAAAGPDFQVQGEYVGEIQTHTRPPVCRRRRH